MNVLKLAAVLGSGVNPNAWDVSQTSPNPATFSVTTEDTVPGGLFFKSDGTKMYVIGVNGQDVNEYSLSSAWSITSASYTQNFSISAKETNPRNLFFSSDGSRMFVIGVASDSVHHYNLSTSWDISTSSFVRSFSVSAQDNAPTGVFFKPDGTKMYIAGDGGNDINEYTLSTAWDISTASYVQVFSIATQDTSIRGLYFKDDGTKMYITGLSTNTIYQFGLSTAWDISTASLEESAALNITQTFGVYFKSDGAAFYVVDSNLDNVLEFLLNGP
jgi:sugar lactone lactonase YvrE